MLHAAHGPPLASDLLTRLLQQVQPPASKWRIDVESSAANRDDLALMSLSTSDHKEDVDRDICRLVLVHHSRDTANSPTIRLL